MAVVILTVLAVTGLFVVSLLGYALFLLWGVLGARDDQSVLQGRLPRVRESKKTS